MSILKDVYNYKINARNISYMNINIRNKMEVETCEEIIQISKDENKELELKFDFDEFHHLVKNTIIKEDALWCNDPELFKKYNN